MKARGAKLSSCRVLECEGFDVSSDDTLELLFTDKAVFVRSGGRDRLKLDRSEINRIEIGELFPASSRKRRVAKAALGISLGVLYGNFPDGWSKADELLESHTAKVTLLTSRGQVVVLGRSRGKPGGLYDGLGVLGVPIAFEPAAEYLTALHNTINSSGPVTITLKDLLLHLGEPISSPPACARAGRMLADTGLKGSPTLTIVGLHPGTPITLKRRAVDE